MAAAIRSSSILETTEFKSRLESPMALVAAVDDSLNFERCVAIK
jgi:hypothetical protein